MQARPAARDQWLIDPGARGEGRLVGRITPAGSRSLYFRYTGPEGERVRLPLSPYDPRGDGRTGFTLQQARDRARELAHPYRNGATDLRGHLEHEREQVAAARAAAEAEARRTAEAAERRVTIRSLFDQWQRAELAPRTLADGTRSGRKDGGDWLRLAFERRVFPKLGHVAAEDVKRADLLAILDDCRAGGRLRTANVLFTDLRQMLRFAVEREIVPFNPLDGIEREKIGGKATERDRTLSDAELRALWAAVPAARMSPRSLAALRLILATGARVGEAMGARWEHVGEAARIGICPRRRTSATTRSTCRRSRGSRSRRCANCANWTTTAGCHPGCSPTPHAPGRCA